LLATLQAQLISPRADTAGGSVAQGDRLKFLVAVSGEGQSQMCEKSECEIASKKCEKSSDGIIGLHCAQTVAAYEICDFY
jgi:hypothetical protein